MSFTVRFDFKPGENDLANEIAQAFAGAKPVSEIRAAAIIAKANKIALMSTGKLVKQAVQAAMLNPPAEWGRTKYRDVFDMAAVIAANRPKQTERRRTQGQRSRLALKVAQVALKDRPLFGKLQKAVRYKFAEDRQSITMGFVTDSAARTSSDVQVGGDISASEDFKGEDSKMRRYLAALGMPIKSTTSLRAKPRMFFEKVTNALNIRNHLEQRFIRALQEKLS